MENVSIPWENSSQSVGNATLSWNNSTPDIEPTLEISNYPTWLLIINIIVRSVEGALSLFGNGLTIVAVTRFESLRTTSNVLICGLAAADFLSGLSPIWMILQYFLQSHFAVWYVFCVLERFLDIYASSLNVCIITAIAVERCIYISWPLHYPSLITMRVAFGSLSAIWLLILIEFGIYMSLGIGRWEGMTCRTLNVFTSPSFKIGMEVTFIVLTIFVVVIYARIASIACHQARRVQEVCMSLI